MPGQGQSWVIVTIVMVGCLNSLLCFMHIGYLHGGRGSFLNRFHVADDCLRHTVAKHPCIYYISDDIRTEL